MKIETGGTIKKNGTSFIAIVHGDGDEADEHHKHKMPEGTTLNVVELTAIKFAVLGAQEKVIVTTKNQYIADILRKEGDEWCKNPKSNVELINEIRSMIEQKSATIEFYKESKARELCR